MVWALPLESERGPADPAAPTPPLRYESPFGRYRAMSESALLPWRSLFDTRGEFVALPTPEVSVEVVARKPAGGHAEQERSGRTVTLAVAAAPASGSDTRARVESINKADAKIKLRHGPIPKLDMPAMTMVFRVANAALLEQVTEGEEVGVTIEKIGSAYVVTGIQR
ncbi:MAG: copper-binding protein [Proteobacteria bacterium]|nr:copper-binding protein [Pseudomonadota bacterium]